MADLQSENAIRVFKDSPNLRELTTRALRNAILNMHFKPGEKLVERHLCEQTGVSRTCVREALRHLESEGLVERVSNRGLFVATVSPDEARQIYEVRAALEAMAGRMFVERADDAHVEQLKAALAKIKATTVKGPVVEYVRALDEFYDVLLRGSGNDVARHILRTLRARMNYLRALTSRASSRAHKLEALRKLRLIVDALRARDADVAAERCREFVLRSASFAQEVLRNYDTEPDSA